MRLEIITIGGEILSGRIADTNFLFLARGLARLGVSPTWHTTVPDAEPELGEVLAAARARAEVILVTGGLGATPDDLTRPALARAFGRELEMRESLWREIAERYAARGLVLSETSSAMARLPVGAEVLPNREGLAPGILLRDARGLLCAMPGVPREMEAIFTQEIAPRLEVLLAERGGRPAREVILRTAGVSETVLAERITTPEGGMVAYLPHAGGVDLRLQRPFGSSLDDEAHARWVAAVRSELGPIVYGEGETTLEEVIGEALVAGGLRLALAESLTAGGVSAHLVRVPGASRYVEGGVVAYANRAKEELLGVAPATLAREGAVSAACALEMAQGARERFSADLGLATTGIAGPEGGTPEKPVGLVWIGLASADGAWAVRRHFPGRRDTVTARAITTALLILHRHLAGIPLEGPV